MPWLTQLVAGLSPQRPKFMPGSVRVGICGAHSGAGMGFSPSYFVLPCQYYFSMAFHSRISSGG
jgi:hypothetical protein